MSDSPNVIRISIEIEAPVGGAAVSVSESKGYTGSSTTTPKKFWAAGTTSPSPGPTPTKVSSSAGTSGEICVKGSTGTSADNIYVALDSSSMPSTEFATTDSAGNWQGTLGGVSCGPYTAPVSHTVRVWHKDHNTGTVEGPEVINFQAFCAPYHECESDFQAEPVGIPIAWPVFRVVATGFQGDRTHFNGEHVVKLRPDQTCQSAVIWTSQPGTQTNKLITLRLIRTGVPHWILLFADGKDQVTYHKPAVEWNTIGANVLTEPSCSCGTASPSVEVHPVLD